MTTILNEAGRNLQVVRLTTVANTCLVFYEYTIKLDDEVRYLWRRKFSFASALLVLCRYLPVVCTLVVLHTYVLTSDLKLSHCLHGIIANSCLILIQFSLSVLVLFTRACAVWEGSRNMLISLALVYAGATGSSAYALFLHIQGFHPIGLKLGNGCVYIIANNHIWYALVIHIACETLALILLLIKSVQHTRVMRHVELDRSDETRGAGLSLLRVMAQDGIGYFLLNLVVTMVNIIVLFRVGTGLRDFLLTTYGAVQNIFCCRLLFHIHTLYDAQNAYGTNYWSTTSAQSGEIAFERFDGSESTTIEIKEIGHDGSLRNLRST